MTDSPLAAFHPVVRAWFAEKFPTGPTAPQEAAWPEIPRGRDVLVASPTGSGKTLTAFLVAINEMWVNPPAEKLLGPRVVYLSPLRALATDVQQNLLQPLAELKALGERMGYAAPDIRVDVRTGDTSSSERASQKRRPAHIYVTTPETFYLLLTTKHGRTMMRQVETIIIDEIHTMCRDKRGSHLTLSLERLERLCSESSRPRPQRIGLSATQRPLDLVASMLSGVGPGRATTILDCSRRRPITLSLELPSSDLDSVLSTEQFNDVLSRLCGIINEHRTTLIFVQSRRLAERLAHLLTEALMEEGSLDDAELLVASHHGSLSYSRRRDVEQRLRSGSLRALVATASLELGIDIGPVEAVCQIGSPRFIATFLQRVGRANHHVGGVPRGYLFPLTRHELVEAIAVLDAVDSGELDVIEPPVMPLDILAQQIVAEVASRDSDRIEDLYDMVRAAAPYRDLTPETFAEVIEMSARGIETGHGAKGALLHYDAVAKEVRPRRGAYLVALLNGGAIPDTGEFQVVLDPEGTVLGSLDEEFAIESSPGDVFLLGTHAWRVVRIEGSKVRVVDAQGAEPNAPFWFGESPGRSYELGGVVADIHDRLLDPLARRDGPAAQKLLLEIPGVSESAATQAVAFLSQSYDVLGSLPTRDVIVIERFFDETHSSHLVIHSPFGARMNRALGLALRKRFCVSFDFELQAAADDDALTIALGPHHSFSLDTVMKMVKSHSVREVLTQAVLPLPMLQVRWRWNASRALLIQRTQTSKKRPINFQRMDAADLLAATWPSLAACQENAPAGPIEIPGHILVRQTIADVLCEPLDVTRLEALLAKVESGTIRVHHVDSPGASLLAHGIINGRPNTFLDDAALEDRRSRAVETSRGTNPRDASGLPEVHDANALDPAAVSAIVAQLAPRVRSADELHDFVLDTGVIRPVEEWVTFYDELVAKGRMTSNGGLWISTSEPDSVARLADDDEFAARTLRGHLHVAGPVTIDEIIAEAALGAGPLRGAPLTAGRAATAMARLEGSGFAMQTPDQRWCARNTYARLNSQARRVRRASYPTVSANRYLGFVAAWQHAAPGTHLVGRDGLLEVIEQLQGYEAPAGEWEARILPARVEGFNQKWLDELCLSGEVTWGRMTRRDGADDNGRGATTPSAATPLTLTLRRDRLMQLRASRQSDVVTAPSTGPASDIYQALKSNGALFRSEMPELTNRLSSEVDEGVWDLVARGLVTADAFSAVRSLLHARLRAATSGRTSHARSRSLRTHRAPISTGVGEGRWSLIPTNEEAIGILEMENLAAHVARQLLIRWGIVAYEHFARDAYRVPWRYVVWALRSLEARGEVIGGRFIEGLAGEQFAHPRALDQLTHEVTHSCVTLSASDPLNLSGDFLDSERIAARAGNSLLLSEGVLSAV